MTTKPWTRHTQLLMLTLNGMRDEALKTELSKCKDLSLEFIKIAVKERI